MGIEYDILTCENPNTGEKYRCHTKNGWYDGQFRSSFRIKDTTITSPEKYWILTNAIDAMHANSSVTLSGEKDKYQVKYMPGWNAYEYEKYSNKDNPYFFYIGPVKSLVSAETYVKDLLNSKLVHSIDRFSVVIALNSTLYEKFYSSLNKIGNFWQFNFYGNYNPGFDPYNASLTQCHGGFFPVLEWSPAREADGIFYQANIVPTSDGRYLEFISNCLDLLKLKNEVENATALKLVSFSGA